MSAPCLKFFIPRVERHKAWSAFVMWANLCCTLKKQARLLHKFFLEGRPHSSYKTNMSDTAKGGLEPFFDLKHFYPLNLFIQINFFAL